MITVSIPIFQENVEFAIPAEAASSSSPAGGVAGPEPVPVPEAPADSEEEGEEPAAKEARLIREAASVEHRLAHFPKNPAQPVKCVRKPGCTHGKSPEFGMTRCMIEAHCRRPLRSVKDLQQI